MQNGESLSFLYRSAITTLSTYILPRKSSIQTIAYAMNKVICELSVERVAVFRVRVTTKSPRRFKTAKKMLFLPTNLTVTHANKTRTIRPVAALAPVIRVWRSP